MQNRHSINKGRPLRRSMLLWSSIAAFLLLSAGLFSAAVVHRVLFWEKSGHLNHADWLPQGASDIHYCMTYRYRMYDCAMLEEEFRIFMLQHEVKSEEIKEIRGQEDIYRCILEGGDCSVEEHIVDSGLKYIDSDSPGLVEIVYSRREQRMYFEEHRR